MADSSSPRILVVDDEPDLCGNLADILEEFGYQVDTAFNGVMALEKLNQHTYDIALLDFKMPEMDGLTLYRQIRQSSPGTTALIVTAYANPGTAEEALQAGAWKVLPKPVDPSSLISLINEAVNQPLILVIDDDEELCQSLWDLFHQQGYRVWLAHDAEEGIARSLHHDFQIVLIDWKLPFGNTRDVIQAIDKQNPDSRTVLITGYPQDLSAEDAPPPESLVDAVCLKPFNIPQLLKMVEELSHRAR